MNKSTLVVGWLLLLTALVAIHAPGLHGSFVFDDVTNIVENDALQIRDLRPHSLLRAARSGIATEFGRPVSMLTFGVNLALTGLDPFYFKLTNLLLHVVNVILAGGFCWLLVANYPCFAALRERAAGVALATAALWALHPFQVSTTLYIVQRMTLLSALFTLAGLLLYASGRIRQWRGEPGAARIAIGLLAFGPLAFLSKETGILLVGYVLVLEFFGSQPSPPQRAQIPTPVLLTALAGGAVVAAIYLWVKVPALATTYDIKGFSATERVLTESRALLWYLKMLVYPDIREMGLTHDDWQVSRSLIDPPSTAPALVAIVAAIAALPWLRTVLPAAGLCLAWFLAGHSLEASPLPLDLIYEHRNYLPSLGIILGLVSSGTHGLQRLRGSSALRETLGCCVIVAALSALTAARVSEWRDPLSWGIAQAQHHPGSAISFLELGAAYATLAEHAEGAQERQLLYKKADAAYAEAARLNPRSASPPASRLILEFRMGHAVPQARLDEIVATIGNGPMQAGSRLATIRVLACAAKDTRCALDPAQFMTLVNAALNNPECPPFFCSQVLALASEFYGEREKDVQKAILFAKAATEVPGAAEEVWLPLVRWLIVGGYLPQAAEALDQLDRIDRLDRLSERRSKFRQDLQARLQQTGSGPTP